MFDRIRIRKASTPLRQGSRLILSDPITGRPKDYVVTAVTLEGQSQYAELQDLASARQRFRSVLPTKGK